MAGIQRETYYVSILTKTAGKWGNELCPKSTNSLFDIHVLTVLVGLTVALLLKAPLQLARNPATNCSR